MFVFLSFPDSSLSLPALNITSTSLSFFFIYIYLDVVIFFLCIS